MPVTEHAFKEGSYYINSGTLIAVDDVEFIFLLCFIVQILNYEYISKETLLFFFNCSELETTGTLK